MKLIDAEIPLEAIRHQMSKYVPDTAGYRSAQTVLRYVEKAINKAPNIDPVVHGQWVKAENTNQEGWMHSRCTACNHCFTYMAFWNYCPDCGAKMDGE